MSSGGRRSDRASLSGGGSSGFNIGSTIRRGASAVSNTIRSGVTRTRTFLSNAGNRLLNR